VKRSNQEGRHPPSEKTESGPSCPTYSHMPKTGGDSRLDGEGKDNGEEVEEYAVVGASMRVVERSVATSDVAQANMDPLPELPGEEQPADVVAATAQTDPLSDKHQPEQPTGSEDSDVFSLGRQPERKEKAEEMDFAIFHQKRIYPEVKKQVEHLEERSTENADLQYVVQSFIKLKAKQPNHYRLGYLRKLILQAIEEFKRKKVLDKVQSAKRLEWLLFLGCFF